MKQAKDKVVVNISGGVMSSIFSVGVLTELEKQEVYDRIEAVYAGSAGVVAGAYFLARQMAHGKKVYAEDLRDKIYHPQKANRLIREIVASRFFKKRELENFTKVLNLDEVYELMTKYQPLDLGKFRSQPVPFYASLLDADTGQVDFLDVRLGSSIERIMAAINIVPWYFKKVVIDQKLYIDGAIKEPFSIRAVRKRHPDSRILMIANENHNRPFYNKVQTAFWALMAEWMLRKPIYNYFSRREKRIVEDFAMMEKDPLIKLVNLPLGDLKKRYSTDKKTLEEFFDHGVQKAKDAVKFIKAN